MCLQIVSAINYLHQQNPLILHRDIKSPNYLLTNSYFIKLCDFNLSRPDTEENRIDTLEMWRTTPVWSAPEIINNIYTEKSDIYSLAIVLWEILFVKYNGYYEYPFDGDNVAMMVRLITKPELRPPLNGIPKKWKKLLEKMWDTNPTIRSSCSTILNSINKIKNH